MSDDTKISISHVSRTLREMEERGLVQKMTISHKGKIYGITEKGLEIYSEIELKNIRPK